MIPTRRHVAFHAVLTDEQLDRAEAAYTVIVALEQEVAAAEAQRASFGARAEARIS